MSSFQTPGKRLKVNFIQKESLLIPPSPFLEKLGYGTGVNVWKLQQSPKNNCPRSPWAIKNVRKNVNACDTQKYQSLLQKEASMLKDLNHENIIGFRGFLKSADGRNCLAMENGGQSLGNIIEERCDEELGPFPAKTILKVVFNVAKALKYLHTEKNILHGDIKSYNIVIKGDFDVIKLCDFGVSVQMDESGVAHEFVGTPVYSAPECQEDAEGPITSKADIFSLGLVIWEMIALYAPHTENLFNNESVDSVLDETDDSVVILNDTSKSVEILDESMNDEVKLLEMEARFGTRPPLPSVELGPEYLTVLELFYCCTEQDPSKRPTAGYLVQYLESILNVQ